MLLEAADKLAEDGISAEVIDLRTLRPMDTPAIIKSVMKTNRCVTVEEGWPQGSVGSYISSVIMQEAFDYLDAPVINCTGKDVPMPYAANLEKHALITTDEVDRCGQASHLQIRSSSHAYRNSHARPRPHHGRGHPCQMAWSKKATPYHPVM